MLTNKTFKGGETLQNIYIFTRPCGYKLITGRDRGTSSPALIFSLLDNIDFILEIEPLERDFERIAVLSISRCRRRNISGTGGTEGQVSCYETRGFIKNALVTDLYDAESGILPGSFAETIK
jgi:hypothetical protein